MAKESQMDSVILFAGGMGAGKSHHQEELEREMKRRETQAANNLRKRYASERAALGPIGDEHYFDPWR